MKIIKCVVVSVLLILFTFLVPQIKPSTIYAQGVCSCEEL